jgi:hypothetical protein
MKKILVCLTLASFAAMTSLQAGEQCSTAKTSAASCSEKTASCCSATKTASAKCSATKVAKKNVDVKGATLLVQR